MGWKRKLGVGLYAAVALHIGCVEGELVERTGQLKLEPEPGVIDMGVVVAGAEPAQLSIRVQNMGSGLLHVSSVRFEGANGPFRVSTLPDRMAAGEATSLFLRMGTGEVGQHTATLVIETSDRLRPRVEYEVRGEVQASCRLSFEPQTLRFSARNRRTINLKNTTSRPCQVTNLLTDGRLFELVGPPVLPFTLQAGQTRPLEINHIAIGPGPDVAVRELHAVGPGGIDAKANLVGAPGMKDCLRFGAGSPTSCYIKTDTGWDGADVWATFARAARGEPVQRTIVVVNICDQPVEVTSAVIGARGHRLFDLASANLPTVIGPGATSSVSVDYSPFEYFGDVGSLLVYTANAWPSPQKIALCGGGAERGRLWAFPRTLDFGEVSYEGVPPAQSECSSSDSTVRVRTSGDGMVSIQTPRLEGDPDFVITGARLEGRPVVAGSWPLQAPAGALLEVGIRFNPHQADSGEHRGRLVIDNDTIDGSATVDLVGTSTPENQVVELFEAPRGARVDLLFVMDDNYFMAIHKARTLANLSRILPLAEQYGTDFQIAVTLADYRSIPLILDSDLLGPGIGPTLRSPGGRFRRCPLYPAILDGDYGAQAADPLALRQEAFHCLYDVEIKLIPPFHTAGLGATMSALDKATGLEDNLSNLRNRGFVRDNAKLAIVVVSDGEDNSLEWLNVVRDFILSVKGGRRDAVALHYIGDLETTRYAWMVDQLGGTVQSIYDEDWGPTIEALGLETPPPLDRWPLAAAPVPASLQVALDGIPVDRADFSFDGASGDLVFAPSATPAPGASIDVEYRRACRP